MAQPFPIQNPFMLLLQPEVVLAAIERSERLGQLTSRVCRPLDKLVVAPGGDETQDLDSGDDAQAQDLEPSS